MAAGKQSLRKPGPFSFFVDPAAANFSAVPPWTGSFSFCFYLSVICIDETPICILPILPL